MAVSETGPMSASILGSRSRVTPTAAASDRNWSNSSALSVRPSRAGTARNGFRDAVRHSLSCCKMGCSGSLRERARASRRMSVPQGGRPRREASPANDLVGAHLTSMSRTKVTGLEVRRLPAEQPRARVSAARSTMTAAAPKATPSKWLRRPARG
jgi:hypothetical protein